MSLPPITLPNGQQVKLGRIPPVIAFDYGGLRVRQYADGHQKVTLRFGNYLDPAQVQAPLPDSTNWRAKAGESLKHMYLNDQYGDCVIAGKYHSVGIWTGNDSDQIVTGTDSEVLAAYHAICGPGDNGCIITDVLDAFRDRGLKFQGVTHKIDDYVSIDWTNKELVKAALQVFGTITLGIDLPSAWTSGGDGSTWDVTNSGSVGGHDVPAIDYDAKGVYISTWGGTRLMTWAAFLSKRWIGEADVPLSPDWYGKDNLAPNGIDAARLKDDLAKLGQGVIPTIDPPPLLEWGDIFP
jgi:hypothetical protein